MHARWQASTSRLGNRIKSVSKRLRRYIRFSDEHEVSFVGTDFGYVWLGHDDAGRFAPAWDPESDVHCVIAGRLCLGSGDWQMAESLPYKGGLAGRVILHKYLSEGPASITPFNGAAAICIWDPRGKKVHAWTDQFGYHPLFLAGDKVDEPSVVTTFPDAINVDPAIKLRPDYVSMVEFLRAWRITPPHTYYSNVKHAGAAAHWSIPVNSSPTREVYWQPFESPFFPTIHDAADQLATALRIAVKERTQVAEHPAFFVSGGADSRVMLFAADHPSNVHGVNLFERPTEESRVAQKLCERVAQRTCRFNGTTTTTLACKKPT